MSDEWKKIIFIKDQDGNSALPNDFLSKVPFAEINMTLLSRWKTNNGTSISVSSQPIKSLKDNTSVYYGLYSRGLVNAKTIDITGNTHVEASAYQGNSSIAGYQTNKDAEEIPVSKYDADYSLSDYAIVNVTGALSNTVTLTTHIYCLKQNVTEVKVKGVSSYTYGVAECDKTGNGVTYANLNYSKVVSNGVASCGTATLNTNGSIPSLDITCDVTKGTTLALTAFYDKNNNSGGLDSFGYSVVGTGEITIPADYSLSVYDAGCITVYDNKLKIEPAPGIAFDSNHCVTSN